MIWIENISEKEMRNAAEKILKAFPEERIFLFSGEMGSGKTTLVREFCRILGTNEECSSPTFSLVNEYSDSPRGSVFHLDLYRLENPEDAFDFGAEEILGSGNFCLVEWPEKAPVLFSGKEVTIHVSGEGPLRSISAKSGK